MAHKGQRLLGNHNGVASLVGAEMEVLRVNSAGSLTCRLVADAGPYDAGDTVVVMPSEADELPTKVGPGNPGREVPRLVYLRRCKWHAGADLWNVLTGTGSGGQTVVFKGTLDHAEIILAAFVSVGYTRAEE